MIDYLTQNDLVHINERTLKAHGGIFNPPHNIWEGTEEKVAAIIESINSGPDKNLANIAARYFYEMLEQGFFMTANERTALLAARLFLFLNGGKFHRKLKAVEFQGQRIPASGNSTTDIWIRLVSEAESKEISLPACQEWFRRNVTLPASDNK